MLGQTFYHATIRTIISAFGTLFNGFEIQRKDNTNTVIQTIKVPIQYLPKQHWFYAQKMNPNAGNVSNDATQKTQMPIQAVFPRMTYELLSLQYINDKKGLTTIKNVAARSGNSTLSTYNPVPIQFRIILYIVAQNLADAYQILEQIIPFFTPDFTLRVKDEQELGIVHDLPIVLEYPIIPQDNWNTDDVATQRREIIIPLEFSIDGRMYGSVVNQALITEVDVRFYADFDQITPDIVQIITPNPEDVSPKDFTGAITDEYVYVTQRTLTGKARITA